MLWDFKFLPVYQKVKFEKLYTSNEVKDAKLLGSVEPNRRINFNWYRIHRTKWISKCFNSIWYYTKKKELQPPENIKIKNVISGNQYGVFWWC